jgi:CsoR family transcriptional regulator, copper-sensing transcriptional repressor
MRSYAIADDDYQQRLRRIEGQVRGLQRMIAEDRYCIDIVHQVAAVRAALESVALGLVDEHLRRCVMTAAERDPSERDSVLTEAVTAVERLVKSW